MFDREESKCKLNFGDDVVLNVVDRETIESGGYKPCH